MALAIDGSTPARWTGTPGNNVNLTSASFTPPNGSPLVLCVSSDSNGTGAVTLTVSGGSLAWTAKIERNANAAGSTGGYAGVWTAVGAGASMTVSVQRLLTAGTNRLTCKCYVLTGHDAVTPFGASTSQSSTTNNLTTTGLTSQAAGLMFFAATEWNALGTITTSDLTADVEHDASQIDAISGYKTIANAGDSVTANLNAGGTAAAMWNVAVLEVRPAAAAAAWPPPGTNPGLPPALLAMRHRQPGHDLPTRRWWRTTESGRLLAPDLNIARAA